jgi:hypothetical protein
MRVRSFRVQSQLRMAQTLEKTGGRGLNEQGPEGRDARGGLRVWKEPHERKLEMVECFFPGSYVDKEWPCQGSGVFEQEGNGWMMCRDLRRSMSNHYR